MSKIVPSWERFVSDEEIINLFTFHPATQADKQAAHEAVRATCLSVAQVLQELLPECPQKTVVLRQKLVEVMFYANQAIAVHGMGTHPVAIADAGIVLVDGRAA